FNNSDNPSGSTRTVSFQVNDGASANNLSNVGARAITVTPVNDASVVTVSGTTAYTENDAATAIAPAISLSDVDSTNLTGATIQISSNYVNGQDILAFTTQNGITGSFNAATGTMTLSGTATVAQYQTALQSITYFNNSDNPSGSTRTVSFQVNDGASANNL